VDFELSKDQEALRAGAIRFAKEALNHGVIERDKNAIASRDLVKRCGEFGVQGSAFPDRYGGLNLDIVSTMALMEDIEFSTRLKWIGKPARLRGPVVTSSRRWETRGILRTVLLMWNLRFLFWLGISPERLARWYCRQP